jgi:hypothetical protein
MNAAAAVIGQVQPDSGIRVKFMPVKIQYTMSSFFSRRDDVNVASQLLYWEANPKFPLYYTVHHTIAGSPIDIPVFMSLEQTDMNVEYAEKDWLVKSRIFPLKTNVVIRTYQVLIEHIDKGMMLPIRFSGLYGYNDKEVYFTQNALLIWADTKWTPDALSQAEAKNDEYADQEGPAYYPRMRITNRDDDPEDPKLASIEDAPLTSDESYDPEEIANNAKLYEVTTRDKYSELLTEREQTELKLMEAQERLSSANDESIIDALNREIQELRDRIQFLQDSLVLEAAETVEEAVKGYFVDTPEVVLDEFRVSDDETTETEIKIHWKMRDEDVASFSHITIYVPGIVNVRYDDPLVTSHVIKGLNPGSTYEITLVTNSTNSSSNTYRLTGKTKGEEIYPEGAPKKLSDLLVGKTLTFTNRS